MFAHLRLFAPLLAASLLACAPRGSPPEPEPRRSSVLSRVDAVPAGAECPAGGKAVRSGLDMNDDGVLQDLEVTTTQLVCLEPAKALLVRVDSEPAGANCPAGGQAVKAGLDANGSGALDDIELERISYVCGAAAPSPSVILTRTTPEAAGAVCVTGGTRVDAGRDRDGNGALSDSEIDQTAFVCNQPAVQPKDVLARQDDAPFGACPGTGTRVRAGADTDGDGVLADTEVTQTVVVCSDTFPAFRVRTAADLALVARATRIAGNLLVEGAELDSVRVPAEVIDGWIIVDSNPKLTTASFAVHLLGGGIQIRNNPALTTVDIAPVFLSQAMQQIPGGVELSDSQALRRVSGLDHVTAIGGSLSIRNTGLELMPSLDHLAFVGGSIVIEKNAALLGPLRTWGPQAMMTVDGDVFLSGNPAWVDEYLTRFKAIGGRLRVADDGVGSVPLLYVPNLERVGGIGLERNTKLGDISMRALTSIDGDFIVKDNSALQLGYGINHIQVVTGVVQVAGNTNLTVLGTLVDLAKVGDLIWIADNPRLQDIWMTNLTRAKNVSVLRNASLTTLGISAGFANLSGLSSVAALTIAANPALVQLSIPSLASAQVLTVEDNVSLPTCAALALAKQLTVPADPVVHISGNAGDATSCP